MATARTKSERKKKSKTAAAAAALSGMRIQELLKESELGEKEVQKIKSALEERLSKSEFKIRELHKELQSIQKPVKERANKIVENLWDAYAILVREMLGIKAPALSQFRMGGHPDSVYIEGQAYVNHIRRKAQEELELAHKKEAREWKTLSELSTEMGTLVLEVFGCGETEITEYCGNVRIMVRQLAQLRAETEVRTI